MLQRQIMYKQLQELQRRQQLQDVSGNQNYANQLSSLKQASGGQIPPTINGVSPHDPSQIFMFGNAQLMGSGGVQGFPNGLFLPQTHSSGPIGLSQQQFDMSLYGTPAQNNDKNSTQFSHFQDPSNLSTDLLTKNNNNLLGMSGMQHPAFGSSFMTQQVSQVLPEKNLFGQVPVHSFNNALSSGGYVQQGITMQRNASVPEPVQKNEDSGASLDPLEQKILYSNDDSIWDLPFGKSGKMGPGGFEAAVENSSYMDNTVPSLQSGSWSALMQSAVAETSSSDNGMQEEWSGLSFQNPEQSTDNQPSNFIDSETPQNNWVDRNPQNITSPSSKPENLFQSSNNSFPGFQQSGYQYIKNKEELNSGSPQAPSPHSPRSMSRTADYDGQQKHPMGGSQLIQASSPLHGIWAAQNNQNSRNNVHQPSNMSGPTDNSQLLGHDLRWLQSSASHHVAGRTPKPFDQENQLNIPRHPLQSEKIAHLNNAQHISAPFGPPSDHHSQNMTVQSESMLELLNKDDDDHPSGMQVNSKLLTPGEQLQTETSVASHAKPSNNYPMSQGFDFRVGQADSRIPQSYSFFPSMSMGNSGAVSFPGHGVNDYVKPPNAAPQITNQIGVKFPPHNAAPFQDTSAASPFPGGLPNKWPDSTPHQHMPPSKTYNFSNNVIHTPDSTSSSLDTTGFPKEQQLNQTSFRHETNVQESGKLEYQQNQLDNGSSAREGLIDINNSTSVTRNSHQVDSSQKLRPGTNAVSSGSLMTPTLQLPSKQSSSQSLSQNYSQLYPSHSPETDSDKRLPVKFDGVNYQQAFANARELFFSGQKSGLNVRTKSDMDAVSELASILSRDNKGRPSSQEAQGDPSGKIPPMPYVQNFQQMDQKIAHVHSIGNNETSNVTHQSQISMQMAPSWFKHYGTLKNGQMVPMYNPQALAGAAQPFAGMGLGSMSETNLIMQAKLSASVQGSQHILPSSMLPADVPYQTLAVSLPKKRKLIKIDILPWNKEINSQPLRLPNISLSELEWARTSNRRVEEVKGEAEIGEDVLPVFRAKRRLTFTTQLMQQVFRPPAAVILRADASSNCNYFPFSAARLVLGDACSLSCQPPPETNDMSPDKTKSSRTNDGAAGFSKVVEGLIIRVKKLEDDLSRVDKSFSIVDIKVAMQELEKFAMINRFARFHIKAQLGAADPASSSGPSSTVPKASPQRYVIALPMPKILPEGTDCLSL